MVRSVMMRKKPTRVAPLAVTSDPTDSQVALTVLSLIIMMMMMTLLMMFRASSFLFQRITVVVQLFNYSAAQWF